MQHHFHTLGNDDGGCLTDTARGQSIPQAQIYYVEVAMIKDQNQAILAVDFQRRYVLRVMCSTESPH